MNVQNNRYLSSLKPLKRLSDNRFFTLDTESQSTENHSFRLGIIHDVYYNKERYQIFKNVNDMVQYLLDNCEIVYCYNLSFDANYIMDGLVEMDIKFKLVESGSNILGMMIYYQDKLICVKDFYPFTMGSLENACKSFNVETKKFHVDFDNCTEPDIIEHCKKDVKMLYELIMKYRKEMFDLFHVDVVNVHDFSLAALGIRVFRTNYIDTGIKQSYIFKTLDLKTGEYGLSLDVKCEEFLRKCYKGGYTNAFDNILHENCYTHDISSSYPFAAIAIPMPIGRAKWTDSFEVFKEKTRKIAGFCEVVIEITEPSLPVLVNDKLTRYVGITRQFLTSYELDWFLSRNKANLVQFIKGCYFLESDKSYAKYCRDIFKLKAKSTGSKREIAKRLLVALYGKFGERIERKRVEYTFSRDLGDVPDGFHVEMENGLNFTFIQKESLKLHHHSFVHWSALITAFARIYLIENLEKCNGFYCDTDSITTNEKTIENSGSGIGMFKIEKKWLMFRAVAPKLYAGITSDYSGLVRAKGVPDYLARKFLVEILNNKPILSTREYTKILKYRESLKRTSIDSQNKYFGGFVKTRKVLRPSLKDIQ